MLIVTLHNDGTGSDSSSDYTIQVHVNQRCIWRGQVHGHNRQDGWPKLLSMLAEKASSNEES